MARALQSYRELRVWQAGIRLVALCYRVSRQFPKSEQFGLASQIQRAAVSIPSNIAEGYGRTHRGDYLRYLAVANGSLKELETELLIAAELGYVRPHQSQQLLRVAEELGRMLRVMIRKLAAARPTPYPLHPTPSH